MFAKDGLGIIIATFLVFIITLGAWYFFPHPITLAVTVVVGILAVFNLFFFRDPDRKIPPNPLAVLSPADGKVVSIKKIEEPEYLKQQTQRISIFLSVFNVHVNRTPISGKIDYITYRTGKFLVAYQESASAENEQTAIGMIDQYGHKILFKQIAGIIARRIVCHLREGQWKNAGERMGLIRYGSRADVFLPPEAKVLVKQGQNVKGGETILATFPNEGNQNSAEKTILEKPKSEVVH